MSNAASAKKRKRKGLPKSTFLAIVIISLALAALLVYWLVSEFAPGEHGGESDGTGSREKISGLIEKLLEGKSITLEADGKAVVIQAKAAGAPVSERELEALALSEGVEKKEISEYKKYLKANAIPWNTYDDGYIRSKIAELDGKMSEMSPSGYRVTESGVVFYRGSSAVSVDAKKAQSDIKAAFDRFEYAPVAASLSRSEIKKPDLAALRQEIFTEAKDAYYGYDEERGTFLVEEVVGRDLDIAAVERAYLLDDWAEQSFDFIVTQPEITAENIQNIFFQSLLGRYSTTFNPNEKGRTANVVLSAAAINGSVILPGEDFSFNKIVGERTPEKGYQKATVYTSQGMKPDYGGGICQVSTTIYVASLYAELEQVKRAAHMYTVGYIALGLDATIAWPYTDYSFKNSTDYPIRIDTSTENGTMTVEIYGTKDEGAPKRDIKFVTNSLEYIPNTIEEVLDPSKEPGYYKLEYQGSNGYRTETYKEVRVNGQLVETAFINSTYHTPYNGKAIVGPPKADATTTGPAPVG